ncbi:hypothetical protein EVAR_34523_1 [Eumeta japonica]|uniref:Uncharacterized protein n=1 Tax=Eumeta variegata TaxID=151549 RepID=A0A4C1Z7I3_EUMVA|nr:hypothetical protein EVAR_34523_1 [Eumeta japonica]
MKKEITSTQKNSSTRQSFECCVARFRSRPPVVRTPARVHNSRVAGAPRDLPEKNVFGEHLGARPPAHGARARRVLIIGLCTFPPTPADAADGGSVVAGVDGLTCRPSPRNDLPRMTQVKNSSDCDRESNPLHSVGVRGSRRPAAAGPLKWESPPGE